MINFKRKFYFYLNRLQFAFEFKKTPPYLEIKVDHKRKKVIKILKYVLTVISLISAFFAFQSSLHAFLFGLFIFVILHILDKFIFCYQTVYIHPMPTFDINNDKWLGMCFGFAQSPDGTESVNIIGMMISDTDYAKKTEELLLGWNYGNPDDVDNNICMSAIIEDDKGYIFFCYPNKDRPSAQEFFADADKEIKELDKDAIQAKGFISIVLGKGCEITPNSQFPAFKERYKDGEPFIFQFLYPDKTGSVHKVPGTINIKKYNLKIKSKADLTRKDMEYDMVRMF